jgi:hypothetical protein
MDDPYIFARYARHLWQYGDLLWNPSEPRVEGFSSWVWLLVYVVGIRLMPDPVVAARLVGFALGVALVVSVGRKILRDSPRRSALLSVIVLGLNPALPYYSVSGMDHIAWTLFAWLYILWIGGARDVRPIHGVVAAQGVLFRPEGFLLFVVPLSLCARRLLSAASRGAAFRSIATRLGPGILALGCFFVARRVAFGAWLPCAAASKHLGGSLVLRIVEGSLYVGHAFSLLLAIPVCTALVAFGWRGRGNDADVASRTKEDPTFVGCVAFAAVSLGFAVVAGGDDVSAFSAYRLVIPAIPPVMYLFSQGLARLEWSSGGLVSILTIVFCALGTQGPAAKELLQHATGAKVYSSLRDVLSVPMRGLKPKPVLALSKYLVEQTPPGETVAVPWAGLVPFQTDLPTIDMLGLNDPEIGRSRRAGRGALGRSNAEYVLGRRPYFICDNYVVRAPLEDVARMSDAELYAMGAWQQGQRELLRHPRLAAEYVVDEGAPAPAGTCFRRRQ